MGLAQALLAALSREPLSGYDLTRRFDGSLGYFWQASHQQIYRELAKLADQQQLDVVIQPQEKRPDRKVYSLTPKGKAALVSWLQTSVQPAQTRDELLVKLYAGGWTSPEQLISELQTHCVYHQQKLQTYAEIAHHYFSQDQALPYAEQCMKLTLDYGIAYEKNWLHWCTEALRQLNLYNDEVENRKIG